MAIGGHCTSIGGTSTSFAAPLALFELSSLDLDRTSYLSSKGGGVCGGEVLELFILGPYGGVYSKVATFFHLQVFFLLCHHFHSLGIRHSQYYCWMTLWTRNLKSVSFCFLFGPLILKMTHLWEAWYLNLIIHQYLNKKKKSKVRQEMSLRIFYTWYQGGKSHIVWMRLI